MIENTLKFFKSFFSKEPMGFFAFLFLLGLVIFVFVFPVFSSINPNEINLDERFQMPSAEHIFGTDHLGRDIFARIVYGGRISLSVCFISTVFAFFIGVSLGIFAGYKGGVADLIISLLIDVSLAIPSLLLAIIAAAVMNGGFLAVVFALSLTGWGAFARISRSAAKQITSNDYISASKILGSSTLSIIFKHVLPNAVSILVVSLTLKMGSFILGEASLSFLGLGINPPNPSWGSMVNEGYRFIYMGIVYALGSIIPGIMVSLTVIAFNLFGDSLRDFYNVSKGLE